MTGRKSARRSLAAAIKAQEQAAAAIAQALADLTPKTEADRLATTSACMAEVDTLASTRALRTALDLLEAS